jgi:hypothetical protein
MNDIMIPDHQIVKEANALANFVSGALGRIKDDINLRDKPFETIFSVLTPVMALRFGFVLGTAIIAADYAFGIGPSWIGKQIDDYLRKGGGFDPEKPMRNLEGASESTMKQIWSKAKAEVGLESKSVLQDIMMVKGFITPNDVVTASHIALHKESQPWRGSYYGGGYYGGGYYGGGYRKPWFGGRGRMGFLRRFVTNVRRGQRLPLFSGALLGLLRVVAKGLGIFMLTGGIAKMVGLKSKKEREVSTEPPTAFKYRDDDPLLPRRLKSQTMQYYGNEIGNVENTLIKFLDASIANFSKAFQTVNGMPLKGSPKMQAVLEDIELLNWGNLEEINKRKAFVAPRVINLAYKLLPEAKYERIKAKPLTKKPVYKTPVSKAPSKAEELSGLLQGVG